MRRPGTILSGVAVLFSGCAPFVWEARPRSPALEPDQRLSLRRLALEPSSPLPEEGVLFRLEGSVTSTEGFVDEPLETPWLSTPGRVAPVLAQTGTIAFDLPSRDHPLVKEWVEFLQGRGRKWFRIWLARSTRYVPLFYSILDRYGLPRDLVFLSMVESGFSPRAFSWASAAGPWQFIPGTARRYGLRVGFWVDERRDFEKSTEAAARHLIWLYTVFEDWHLAMAAYNAGAGRIRGALRGQTKDFWALQGTRRLRRETEQYVPKILASAIISKQPERFGFSDVPYQPPLSYETVTVTVATSLETLGEACGGLPKEALEELNPALRVSVTPPGEAWPVRVPPGLASTCADGLAGLPAATRLSFRYHEARLGETVEEIAERFGTSSRSILEFHGHEDPAKMLEYAEIAVPVPYLRAPSLPIVLPPQERLRGGSYAPSGLRLVSYEVRAGDSLWKIARRFGVSMGAIRQWNGLSVGAILRIGRDLRVYLGSGGGRRGAPAPQEAREARVEASAMTDRHRVREGESLWGIARRYGTTVERLLALNGLRPGQVLSIGQLLRVR